MEKTYKIDSTIYPDNHVLTALNTFWEIADISYCDSNIIISTDEDHDIIFSELMNFIIWLINE